MLKRILNHFGYVYVSEEYKVRRTEERAYFRRLKKRADKLQKMYDTSQEYIDRLHKKKTPDRGPLDQMSETISRQHDRIAKDDLCIKKLKNENYSLRKDLRALQSAYKEIQHGMRAHAKEQMKC